MHNGQSCCQLCWNHVFWQGRRRPVAWYFGYLTGVVCSITISGVCKLTSRVGREAVLKGLNGITPVFSAEKTANSGMTRSMKKATGFSLIEILTVVAVSLVLAAIAAPNIMRAVRTARLRSTGADLAGLIQDARIMAAKSNSVIAVQFTGNNAAYLDPSNGSYIRGDLLVDFGSNVTLSPAPTGGVSPYTMSTDPGSTALVMQPPATVMAFSKRGLPCDYSTPPTCQTPALNYFVYYLNSPYGWAAVVVTRAGRSRVSTWTGSAWSN